MVLETLQLAVWAPMIALWVFILLRLLRAVTKKGRR